MLQKAKLEFAGCRQLFTKGFLGGSVGKELACNAGNCLQCRRHGFDSWVRKIPWRRKWQPTPVFSPGEFHGQRSLVGYSAWGCKELDMTEWLTLSLSQPSGSNASWQWIHTMWPHINNCKTRIAVLHIAVGEYIHNTSVKICTYSSIRRSVTF